VASFMGYENIFGYEDGAVTSASGRLPFAHAVPAGTRSLGWRPEGVRVGAGEYRGRVMARSYQGQQTEFLVQSPLGLVKGMADASAPWIEGQEVSFDLGPAGMVPLVEA